MIIAKAPLRISIGGGGTDLPSYYQNYGSMFISAAINKYVYISVHPIFMRDIILKYSEVERVSHVDQIKHPLIREVMRKTQVTSAVEICSFADIPAGTGLGSSGSFTVSLLKALYTHRGVIHDAMTIGEDACQIEIERLKSPVGKQDQYIAALGGINRFDIDCSGAVRVSPLQIDPSVLIDLEEHLLLFFTGFSRSANVLLKEQDDKTKFFQKKIENEPQENEIIQNLNFVQKLAYEIETALLKGQLDEFAKLMNVHWEYKKKRSENISNSVINSWYELAMKNGALGGKLIGAGGGGFLMFLAEDKRKLRQSMRDSGLVDVPFRFDHLGTQVVLHG